MSSRTSRLSIFLSRSSVSRVKTTAGGHLLPTRLPGYRRGSDIGELTGEICADAFFQNVCELDLVFSFYKVSRDGFAWMGTLLRGDYGYRCMRSWTKCSWLGRLKRRASKWCWTDWTTWRSWVNLAFICSVTVEYVIVYPSGPHACRVECTLDGLTGRGKCSPDDLNCDDDSSLLLLHAPRNVHMTYI